MRIDGAGTFIGPMSCALNRDREEVELLRWEKRSGRYCKLGGVRGGVEGKVGIVRGGVEG